MLRQIAGLCGVRQLFLFGQIAFVIRSVLSAIAPNYPLLLGARLIQGLGAASGIKAVSELK